MVERRGDDFFGASKDAAMPHVHKDDRKKLAECCTEEQIIHDLDKYGVFNLDYRIMEAGHPLEVHMKAMRMHNDRNHIIIGVSGYSKTK